MDVLLVEAPAVVRLEVLTATVAEVVPAADEVTKAVTFLVKAEVATAVVFAIGLELPLPTVVASVAQLLVKAFAISAIKHNCQFE